MNAHIKIPLIISISFSYSLCYTFNTKEVLLIEPHENVKNMYFGYSLLLQTSPTSPSIVIVGAPKDKVLDKVHYGGQAYECTVNKNSVCTPVMQSKDPFSSLNNHNGDFFGGSLDGEDHVNGAIMICSPRASVQQLRISTSGEQEVYVFTPGSCIYKHENLKSETFISINASDFLNNYYVRKGGPELKIFFDYGYASFGFDISFLNKDTILTGVPGLKNLNGATILLSSASTRFGHGRAAVEVLPKRGYPVSSEEDSYFGYSVDSEIFQQSSSNDVCFLAGEPRGNNLTGKVLLYRHDKKEATLMKNLTSFKGMGFGYYFGASVLAVDVSNDSTVDILIGAPMTAGTTYDEGIVYFYKGYKNTFLPCLKITGSSQKGSRFGTTIVSLGDFDLDGYKDIAISAPYENDGEGAVYIYRGSSDGLSNQYSQKLVPSKFSVSVQAKGFGLSMSRGNDIDQNGHNDIAIGAYKTDQVFIISSYGIIDYQVSLIPTKKSLNHDTKNFDVTLCLNYTKRSMLLGLPDMEFNIKMALDYRSSEKVINKNVIVKLLENRIETNNIKIGVPFTEASPFHIKVDVELSAKYKNIMANGKHNLELKIPYTLGCLNYVCTTGLNIELNSNRKQIILGHNRRLDLQVSISNDGEPAYLCKLLIQVPASIQLRNSNSCTRKHRNYTCPLADKLDKSAGVTVVDFDFDINFKNLKVEDIVIQVRVTSVGVNKNDKDKGVFTIPVIANRTSYINGTSIPENTKIKEDTDIQDSEVTFHFTVGKSGPSPVELDLHILLPMVQYNEENIFPVVSVKGTLSTVQVICQQANEIVVDWDEILPQIDAMETKAILVHCSDDACTQFSCYGDHLNTSDQTVVVEVKVVVRSKHLTSRFRSELRDNNLIAYIPIVLQKNSSHTDVGAIAITPFYINVENVKSIPFWAYLVAVICSTGLFILMVLTLYKVGFFNRTYKDQLEREQILNNENQRKNKQDLQDSTSAEEENEEIYYNHAD